MVAPDGTDEPHGDQGLHPRGQVAGLLSGGQGLVGERSGGVEAGNFALEHRKQGQQPSPPHKWQVDRCEGLPHRADRGVVAVARAAPSMRQHPECLTPPYGSVITARALLACVIASSRPPTSSRARIKPTMRASQASSPTGVSCSSRRCSSTASCGACPASAGATWTSQARDQPAPGLSALNSCCATLRTSAPLAASSRTASPCSAVRSASGMLSYRNSRLCPAQLAGSAANGPWFRGRSASCGRLPQT
jgi:hypothetical protein